MIYGVDLIMSLSENLDSYNYCFEMLYALVFSICQSARMAYFSTKIVVVVQQATVTVLDAVTPTSYQPVGGVAAEAKPCMTGT